MEISTEINRVFGQEMAKLFADKVDQKELESTARNVWKDMTDNGNGYYRHDSQIEKYIKEEILKRLHQKIINVLKEPVNEDALEKKAREMVEQARKIGEELIVKNMAQKMAENTLYVYGLDEVVTRKVMDALYVKNDEGLR